MDTSNVHRKRCRRYDIDGHAHYLTFSCFRRQPFLLDGRVPLSFLECVAEARRECRFALWAWVIMPEHVHLLIWPAGGSRISDILWRIKRRMAYRVLSHLAEADPTFIEERMTDRQPNGKVARRFWQRGGGYDRNIVSVGQAREKIEYIHANPVRRGLVTHPSHWRWSSWRAWTEGADDPLAVDRETLPTH